MPTNYGTVKAYPIFRAVGPGNLYRVSNFTTNQRIDFDIEILSGEILTLDLRPGRKTFISTFRGSVISYIVEGSDTNAFHLQPGDNIISIFIDNPLAFASMVWDERHLSWAGVASNE